MIKKVFHRNGLRENGVITVEGTDFFYKSLPLVFFQKELNGYKILSKYYPVPNLIRIEKGDNTGLLVFEYENSVDTKKGLLINLFTNKKVKTEDFNPLLELYKKVFLKTLKKDKGKASDIFFKDRISTRLEKFYSPKFIKSINDKEVFLNGNKLKLQLEKTISTIKSFFKKDGLHWCVISQGDPNDLNLGLKPVLFDYEAAGWNPLMAEFANLFVYNLIQGSYLGPVYSKASYKRHKEIYKYLDKVRLSKNKLEHKTLSLRRKFVFMYIKKVLMPCFHKIENYNGWYEEFKNYFAMKILCRFDISKMPKKDMILSLCFLEYFYNTINPKSFNEFLSLTKKIWLVQR
ncbi:MAG: hypothetical protein Q8Q90_03370 [bacterium]|nr:hypothetical protein [bacterium]